MTASAKRQAYAQAAAALCDRITESDMVSMSSFQEHRILAPQVREELVKIQHAFANAATVEDGDLSQLEDGNPPKVPCTDPACKLHGKGAP